MMLRALMAILAGGMLAATAPDAEILELLTAGVKAGRSVGIVAGIIEPRGRRVVSYGSFGTTNPRPVDGESLFEIGSMTKVFTSLLLADMVERGEVALTDPVARYLPGGVKVPERGGMQITLQDLSMHRSGLPRLPSNLLPKVLDNPYTDYTADLMYAALAGYELTRDIGAEYEYSNLGAGLLGHALARRAGMDYEALVRTRILEPLAMKSTAITVPTSLKPRLTNGHDGARRSVSYWDFDVLAGAGALLERWRHPDAARSISSLCGHAAAARHARDVEAALQGARHRNRTRLARHQG
jgi:serine-type D-Ala-D-Ala carboxypeptidase/endopeptidase